MRSHGATPKKLSQGLRDDHDCGRRVAGHGGALVGPRTIDLG
jgi:hypothetical protein